MSPNTIDWDQDLVISEEESYLSLRNALKRNQGFGLYFVRSLPFQTQHIINNIKRDLPNKKIGILPLTGEVDNLFNLIINFPDYQNLDVLFISGLELSLFRYEKRESEGLFLPSQSAVYGGKWAGVPSILGHLNLSRERFREHFPFSIVFCLPEFALRYFIRRAPDFFDWRSGVYEFPTERKAINSELIWPVYKKEKDTEINFFIKFLWFCAGANIKVLKNCQIDHDRYATIGFTVLNTAILASLSGGYAFWTIFNSATLATILGGLWGLIIGNLDRFLVSTLRKKDHWSVQQTVSIVIRMLGSIVIGFAIAVPLQIKIFETPIRMELAKQNTELRYRLETRFAEIKDKQDMNKKLQQELDILQEQRNKASLEVICEIDGTCGSNKVGKGPAFIEKQQKHILVSQAYEKKKQESEKQINENNELIDKFLKEILREKEKTINIITQVESLERLSKGDTLYGYTSSLITFIFVFFNATPILAKLLRKRSFYDIALQKEEEIAALLKIRADSDETWYNRGNALAELGRLEEASASYDNALRIKPDDYKVWSDRGIALLNLGKNEEAISSFDNALKFKPDYHEAWYYRGILLLNLGKNEEAISSFDNALKFKPDDAATYYNKACTYALQKNISLALENLKQAINLDSKYLEKAKTNTDFDKICRDRRFINLLNAELPQHPKDSKPSV